MDRLSVYNKLGLEIAIRKLVQGMTPGKLDAAVQFNHVKRLGKIGIDPCLSPACTDMVHVIGLCPFIAGEGLRMHNRRQGMPINRTLKDRRIR
ncbi:hypothetical protein D3C87_1956800 [compost metagenome]